MALKLDKDEILVKLVEHESVIWKRNHPQFKNVQMKEQAWARVAYQLGISSSEAERRFKSIREKYRRRKILLDRDQINNVEHSKLKRWDLYHKLGFLDNFMIPRNGNESLGMICKSESVSSENITSTNNNELSVHALPMLNTLKSLQSSSTTTASILKSYHQQQQQQLQQQQQQEAQDIGNLIIKPMIQIKHQTLPAQSNTRSSMSTPSTLSPITTTADMTKEYGDDPRLSPIIKMEVPFEDEDEEHTNSDTNNGQKMEQKNNQEHGNFNYVGEFIAAELNKLPLRDAFVLKNILVREVLNYSERMMMDVTSNNQQ